MKNTLKLTVIITVFFIITGSRQFLTADQGLTVSGMVRNEAGSPLVGAVISLFKENWTGQALLTTRSSREGNFTLLNLMPGKYIINIVKSGYEPLSYAITAPLVNSPLLLVLKPPADDENKTKNWDLETVLRASTERNPIFRNQPTGNAPNPSEAKNDNQKTASTRSGTFQVSTIQPLGLFGDGFFPALPDNGISTRFAYVEPLSRNSTYVITGMLTTGADRRYQVKNILNYKLANGRKVQLSLGYDKSGVAKGTQFPPESPASSILENEIIDTIRPIENISVGFQDYFQIFEPLTMVYGFDLNYNSAPKGSMFINPRFQLYLNPSTDVSFRFLLNSDRISYDNTLKLKEGQFASLPPLEQLMKSGDRSIAQFNHIETGLSFLLDRKTNLEITSFLDEVAGSGYPFVVVLKNPVTPSSRYSLLTGDTVESRGIRLQLTHKWTTNITSSMLYIYGSGVEMPYKLADNDPQLHWGSILNKRFFNIFSTSFNARVPKTDTNISAVYRHTDGSPLNSIDPYSDFYNLADKSLSVFIRQAIPVNDKSPGKWEAVIDFRNILNQGVKIYQTATGDLILVRTPRSFRGGISYRF